VHLLGAVQQKVDRRRQAPDEAAWRARRRSLQTLTAELAAPLPLGRIAAAVGRAAIDLLDVEIVVIAAHVDVARRLRAVHVVGLSEDGHDRLSAAEADEADLIAEIERSFGAGGPPRAIGALAVVPIHQVLCPRGLMIVGRVEARPFSEAERTFAALHAGIFGLALDRLRLTAERSLGRERLRRRRDAVETSGTHLRVGDMDIDLVGHSVLIDGRSAALTTSEIRLLGFLAEQPGRARTRREILGHLWRTEHVGDERACDVHVSNLRRKIEQDPSRPRRLVTVRGYGYALMPRWSSEGRTRTAQGATGARRGSRPGR
jgi:DNA-binding winged helix-turn-helix (wHTH) protein